MSINSIGFIGGYCYNNSGLSEETKQKLLALGIDPSTVASEAQAKILIENILKLQNINETKPTKTSNTCSSECEIISKIKVLSKKVGAVISENMQIEEMFAQISATINKKLSQPNQNNETLTNLKNNMKELSNLQEEFSTVKQNEKAMFASMNFNANINKMMLGLN